MRWTTFPAALGIVVLVSNMAQAHLCNDVFVQAKDNLAVKVDIRDGQLRIGKEASFRVYLLNTMDRDIVDIRLEVLSDQFTADVKPSPEWNRFPMLRATKNGGKKEYLTVTLARKDGVPDGKYDIKLHLFNGKDRSMCFKTVDLDSAAGICRVPTAKGVVVDGKANAQEWASAFLCADFYEYQKAGRYFENRPARDQSRVRVAGDAQNLFLLFSLQGGQGAGMDAVSAYFAPTTDAKPVQFAVDRVTGRVHCDNGTDGIETKISAEDGVIECRIPRKLLGIDHAKSFYANFTRTVASGEEKVISYWRGNLYSALEPIVYGCFAAVD